MAAGRGTSPRAAAGGAQQRISSSRPRTHPTQRPHPNHPAATVSTMPEHLAALDELDLDTADPPGSLIKDRAARLRNGKHPRLGVFE